VADGARLESVYTGNRIEGSNPSLSAIALRRYDFLQTAAAHPAADLRIRSSLGTLKR
jgi:hypothetical protein